MAWTDQCPPATDILVSAHITTNASDRVWFEIDKLGDCYRLTVGNLFGSQEVARNDLESVVRRLASLRRIGKPSDL